MDWMLRAAAGMEWREKKYGQEKLHNLYFVYVCVSSLASRFEVSFRKCNRFERENAKETQYRDIKFSYLHECAHVWYGTEQFFWPSIKEHL